MAINKNFVIKNGVEVNTSLIVGDATLNKVGVGTTVPGYTLHVGGSRGGIGATDLTVTGIATVGTSGSTSAALSVVGVSSFQGDVNFLGSAGVSTITFDASLDKLNFADNARATFGASDDLQIFHDGSNSIIRETGEGNIVLEGSGETLAVFADDGAVSLYYDNTNVFQTTPQGINVTGVATALRLNVAGVATVGSLSIGSTEIVDTSFQLKNIESLDATTTATIETAIASGPNTFDDLKVTGITTLGFTTATTIEVGNEGLTVAGVTTQSGDLVVGVSTLFADVSTGRIGIGTAVPASTLDVDGALTVNSAKVEDLTDNRIVIAGSSGELEDDSNLTFDGVKLNVGSGVTIFPHGGAAFAGIVTVGGDLNVQGDITYDEIGGRNINITGFSTFGNDLNVGLTTFFVDVSNGGVGVGTDNPNPNGYGPQFKVFGNNPVLALEDDGGGVNAFGFVRQNSNTLQIVTGDNSDNKIQISKTSDTSSSWTGSNLTNIVTIDQGNIGVGIATATLRDSSKLDVDGDARFSGKVAVRDGGNAGVGVTIFDNGNIIASGIVTAGTALVAASAKVEDLTDNRVVLAGTGGELEDSANLTFDGAGLVVTGNANISGVSTLSNDLIVGVSTFFADVSAGRIGIGTDSPARKVEIFDTAATVLQLNSTNASGTSLRIQHSGTDKTFVGLAGDFITGQANNVTDSAIRASGALLFASGGGTERARITSGGDVGIGTTVPETPRGNRGLEVAGTTGAEFVATRFDDNLVDGDFIGGFVFKNLDAGGSPNHFAGMYAKANGTAGSMDLHFTGDRAQYESDTSDLTIRSSNVGIGTTLPQDTLDVAADVPQIRITDTSDGSFGQIRANGGNFIVRADEGNTIANSLFVVEIDGDERLRITDNNDVVLGGGATVGSSSGIVTFIGDGSQLTGVISGIDITEDAGLVGAAITNLKFTGSGISTVTTDTTVGIATINITGGGGGGVSETDTSVSTTTATGVGSFAVATHRSAAIIAQIDQGGSYQVGRYLMIHDGTTATVIEESAIATGDMLGSFTADVNNSNAELKVTMNSSGIATVTTKIDTVTV